ncbi:MAG: serine/threonine-protein kinase, partial [Planctomycetaceae bacterium]
MSTLIAALESLWSASTEPPDLNSWWSSVTAAQKEVSADEVLSALLLDQRNRWRTAKPLTAEDYIRTVERLPDGIDWPLELAAGEFEARTAASQTLSIDEFTARFPAVAETLRDRLQQIASDVIPTEIVTGVVRMQADVLNDRYRLDRLLGQGRFGKVFLAWDLQLQRDVAIKVPTDIRFQDLRHAEDYLREARTLARVDHPGILPVYDVGCTADSQLYVVSRFIDGITLGKLLKQQRPALETVSRILIPVAEALAFAHDRRIIHRDVKPDNILIEVATGRPFLADFGLAVGEQDYTERSELAGTPAYMSPEQV